MPSDPLREAIERALPCECDNPYPERRCPRDYATAIEDSVAPLLAAERERREAAERALKEIVNAARDGQIDSPYVDLGENGCHRWIDLWLHKVDAALAASDEAGSY